MADKPMYAMSKELLEVREAIAEGSEVIDASTGEVTDGDRLAVLLASLKMDMSAKVAGCIALAAEARYSASSFKAEEARLAARRKTMERADEHLRRYVAECMAAAGLKTIEAGTFRVTLCAGRESVVVEDAERVPEAFQRVKVEPDVAGAKAMLAETGSLPAGFAVKAGSPFLRVT